MTGSARSSVRGCLLLDLTSAAPPWGPCAPAAVVAWIAERPAAALDLVQWIGEHAHRQVLLIGCVGRPGDGIARRPCPHAGDGHRGGGARSTVVRAPPARGLRRCSQRPRVRLRQGGVVGPQRPGAAGQDRHTDHRPGHGDGRRGGARRLRGPRVDGPARRTGRGAGRRRAGGRGHHHRRGRSRGRQRPRRRWRSPTPLPRRPCPARTRRATCTGWSAGHEAIPTRRAGLRDRGGGARRHGRGPRRHRRGAAGSHAMAGDAR